MSAHDSSNLPGPFRKPQADLYTVLLVVALLALIVATVFLYLETQDYPSPPYKGGSSAAVWVSSPGRPAGGGRAAPAILGWRPAPPPWKTTVG